VARIDGYLDLTGLVGNRGLLGDNLQFGVIYQNLLWRCLMEGFTDQGPSKHEPGFVLFKEGEDFDVAMSQHMDETRFQVKQGDGVPFQQLEVSNRHTRSD